MMVGAILTNAMSERVGRYQSETKRLFLFFLKVGLGSD
jgi:hypothetical protein